MPSFPIRPTFPIDVRSPSGSMSVGRQGTAVTLDLVPGRVLDALPITSAQLFAALESLFPGSSATVSEAVPSDITDPINRAYRTTTFVRSDSPLLLFIKATLGLTDDQVRGLLAAAALQSK